MVRLLIVTLLVLPAGQTAAEKPDRYRLQTGIDLSYVDSSGYASFTQGSVGKLRYDSDNEGLTFGRAYSSTQTNRSGRRRTPCWNVTAVSWKPLMRVPRPSS